MTEDMFALGKLVGREQAFGVIASQSAAAQAKCLKEVRDTESYRSLGLSWDPANPTLADAQGPPGRVEVRKEGRNRQAFRYNIRKAMCQMLDRRLHTIALLMIVVSWVVAALTQPPTGASSYPVLGTLLRVTDVQILDQAGARASIQYTLLPQSQPPICAFGSDLIAHYADGSILSFPNWEDELEGTYMFSLPGAKVTRYLTWGGPLLNGESSPRRSGVQASTHGSPLQFVTVKITALVFMDRTAMGDNSVIHSIADHRLSESQARMEILDQVQAVVDDPPIRAAIAAHATNAAESIHNAVLARVHLDETLPRSTIQLNELRRFESVSRLGADAIRIVLAERRRCQQLFADHSTLILKDAK